MALTDTGKNRFVLKPGPVVGRMTDDELFEFCALNPELRIERTKDGEIIVMTPTGGETGRRNFDLSVAFGVWAKHDGSGIGFDSSTGFILANGAERSPDVAWVRKERWETLSAEERSKFPPLCPDFVVELRSPSDSLSTLQEKLREYIENGAQLGWLLDPTDRTVWVYRPDGSETRLDDPETVSGDPELPGFVLAVREIW